MSLLDRLFPDDHKLAATKYPGRESASSQARRREAKPAKNAAEAARLGQAWEDEGRRAKPGGY